MLNLVLFGPPGAGKGTQSKMLIEKYGLIHLSTGDLLRNEIAEGTVLGMQAKAIMDRGELVSDEIVIGMIESKIDANPGAKGFIFDGFPRTIAQANALDAMLQTKHTSITMMIALEVNDEELLKRLLLRGAESGRADDQNEMVIRRRITEYNNKTAPLKQFYSNQHKFHSVYGIGTVEQIFELLCATIDNKTKEKEIHHDGTVTVADISTDDEPAKHLKEENKTKPVKSTPKAEKPVSSSAVKKVKKTGSQASGKKSSAVKKSKSVSKKKTTVAKKKAKPSKPVKKIAKKATKKTAKKSLKKSVAKKVAKVKSGKKNKAVSKSKVKPKKAIKAKVPAKKGKVKPKKQAVKKAKGKNKKASGGKKRK